MVTIASCSSNPGQDCLAQMKLLCVNALHGAVSLNGLGASCRSNFAEHCRIFWQTCCITNNLHLELLLIYNFLLALAFPRQPHFKHVCSNWSFLQEDRSNFSCTRGMDEAGFTKHNKLGGCCSHFPGTRLEEQQNTDFTRSTH